MKILMAKIEEMNNNLKILTEKCEKNNLEVKQIVETHIKESEKNDRSDGRYFSSYC